MPKHNPSNERIKRKYLVFQKEACQQSESTIDSIAKSLSRFEEHSQYRDFNKFHFEQAVAFKRKLLAQKNERTGEALSKSTVKTTLNQLRRFIEWLSQQTGYRSRLNYCDAEYFNLSEKDARIAAASRPKKIPTLEQIKAVIENMPAGSDIELRNRALLSFVLLTGARDSAVASMSLKHVDIAEGSVFQDAREVNTKFSKTFTTYFFPVGDEVQKVLQDWVEHLRIKLLWGEDDPLFPSTKVEVGPAQQFAANGLQRVHWRTTNPIRDIFKSAFVAAGLPYYNPHSFRDTLVGFAERRCRTPEEFKAWSQNLGHENVMTTFTSYGEVSETRVSEILSQVQPSSSLEGKQISKERLLNFLKDC